MDEHNRIKNEGVVEIKHEGGSIFEEELEEYLRTRGQQAAVVNDVIVIGDRHIDIQEERSWLNEKRPRRVGILVGLGMAAVSLASLEKSCYLGCGFDETYDDYRLRIRHDQVRAGIRIPPKKAQCSGRRRGRRFKG